MVASISTAVWIVIAVAAVLALVLAYVFGTKREEREKRSGANLEENGGYAETTTNVQIRLTNRRDTSVEANNAFFGLVTGEQQTVDYEYDRYKYPQY